MKLPRVRFTRSGGGPRVTNNGTGKAELKWRPYGEDRLGVCFQLQAVVAGTSVNHDPAHAQALFIVDL